MVTKRDAKLLDRLSDDWLSILNSKSLS
jgi:hypothetical protein